MAKQPQHTAQTTLTYFAYTLGKNPLGPYVATLDVTYDTKQTVEGAAQGYYKVVGISGTYHAAGTTGYPYPTLPQYPITGLISKDGFQRNDNRIYLGDGSQTPVVDKQGIAFKVSMPTKAHPNRMQLTDLRSTASGKPYPTYRQDARLQGSAQLHQNDAELVPPVCFVAGTHILTTRGEVAVEALAVGDLVVTTTGAARPIRWLGHRTIETRRSPRPLEVMPVRIAAHAFGPQRPARDLRVSPGHALCLDVLGAILVPAVALVDGASIVQETVERVTYWHVELDSHDVILAENLPAESYLEMSNRAFFVESGLVGLATVPDAPAGTHADFCRPYVDGGPLIEAARARIAAQAAASAASKGARAA